MLCKFFFKQKTAYEMRISDWSSDVCSSDLLPAILEKTNEAGIPVYGSEIEQMKLGCVAGAGLDYIKLGIQTGQMAAKILRGETTCQDTPYEVIENYDLRSAQLCGGKGCVRTFSSRWSPYHETIKKNN